MGVCHVFEKIKRVMITKNVNKNIYKLIIKIITNFIISKKYNTVDNVQNEYKKLQPSRNF
jgi:hypothetical protein